MGDARTEIDFIPDTGELKEIDLHVQAYRYIEVWIGAEEARFSAEHARKLGEALIKAADALDEAATSGSVDGERITA